MAKENEHDIQGEGNRDAANRYNQATKDFVEKGGLEKAEASEQISADEAANAEAEGRSRAKEFDPAVTRNHKSPDLKNND